MNLKLQEQSNIYKSLMTVGESYLLYILTKHKLEFYLTFITDTPLETFNNNYELIIINNKIIAVMITHVLETSFKLSKADKYFINTESMLTYIDELYNGKIRTL